MTSHETIGVSGIERGLTQDQIDVLFTGTSSKGDRAGLASVWLASFWEAETPYEELDRLDRTPFWLTTPEYALTWDQTRSSGPEVVRSGEHSWVDTYISLNPVEAALALYFTTGLVENEEGYPAVKLIVDKTIRDARSTAEGIDKKRVEKLIKFLELYRKDFINGLWSR